MTGSYDFYRALFKQTGIVEIQEIHEAVDYLKALDGWQIPGRRRRRRDGGIRRVRDRVRRRRRAVGSGAMRARRRDAANGSRRSFRTSAPSTIPIDLTAGYFSAANQEKLETAVKAVLDDPNVHAVCVNLATTGKAGSLVAAEVLGRVAASTDKPIVVFSSTPASQTGDALRLFAEARIPVLPFSLPRGEGDRDACQVSANRASVVK